MASESSAGTRKLHVQYGFPFADVRDLGSLINVPLAKSESTQVP